jgi:hypothetical protein
MEGAGRVLVIALAVGRDVCGGMRDSFWGVRSMFRLLRKQRVARIRILQTLLLNVPLLLLGLFVQADGMVTLCHWLGGAILGSEFRAAVIHNTKAAFPVFDEGDAVNSAALTQRIAVIDNVGRMVLMFGAVIPYFVTASVLSGIWASHVSRAGYEAMAQNQGKIAQRTTSAPASPFQVIAEAIYRALLIQVMNVYVIALDVMFPVAWLGRPAALLLCALASSFTVFDTVWSHKQVPLQQRFELLERHWTWYLGFGLLTAAMTFFATPVINASVYAIVFPWVVLIAMNSSPQASAHTPRIPVLAPFTWIIRAVLRVIPYITKRVSASKAKANGPIPVPQ